jgi:hypothetical protein
MTADIIANPSAAPRSGETTMKTAVFWKNGRSSA